MPHVLPTALKQRHIQLLAGIHIFEGEMAYTDAFVISLICAAPQTSVQESSARQNRVRAEMDNLHFTDTLWLREMRRSKHSCLNPTRQAQDPRPVVLKRGRAIRKRRLLIRHAARQNGFTRTS